MWVPVSPHLSGELLGPFLAAKTIIPQHPLTAEGVALTACPVLEERAAPWRLKAGEGRSLLKAVGHEVAPR